VELRKAGNCTREVLSTGASSQDRRGGDGAGRIAG
jgi:hypothetical protein